MEMHESDLLILRENSEIKDREFKNPAWRLASEGLISVSLSNGMSGIVKDTPDANELLSTDRWCGESHGYMITSRRINGKKKNFKFHRLLMNPPKGFDVDHINGCRLDNRPENLRIVSRSVNSINRAKVHHKFGIAGVSYDERWSRYVANWQYNGKKIRVYFSVKRYGHELARKLAIQARKDGVAAVQTYMDNEKMPHNFDPAKYALPDEYFHGCMAEPVLFETKE